MVFIATCKKKMNMAKYMVTTTITTTGTTTTTTIMTQNCLTHVNFDFIVILLSLVIRIHAGVRGKVTMNIVSAQEFEMWATLGLLRGVASPEGAGRAFCNRKWVELLMGLARKASPLSSHTHGRCLVQEVCCSLTAIKLPLSLPSLHIFRTPCRC